MLQKVNERKYPYSSMIDNMVTDPSTETTTGKESTSHETSTIAAKCKLQVYICGWEKITSDVGLVDPPREEKVLERVETKGLTLTSTSYEATGQISRVKHSDGTQTKVRRASALLLLERELQAQKDR